LDLLRRWWFKQLVFGLVFLKEKVSGAIPKQQYPTLSNYCLPNVTTSKGEPLKCLPNAKKKILIMLCMTIIYQEKTLV
jgi:hypothetical protein